MQSRSQAFWNGVRRVGKFGAIAGIVLWLIIDCGCLGIMLFLPLLREKALADLRQQSVLSAIGGFIAPMVMMAIIGAVPGALITGIADMSHPNRDAAPGFRFTLRTLLIATTLVAVGLGLMFYTVRK
jgi:Na+/H+-dicarboxylate symporter